MAARKEILDFILLERTETPPNSEKVQIYALRILDLYNERKADLLTLQNDLFELVATCKLYECGGMKHTTPDFEQAITLLLQTATDWELFLPETEIQRYERVSLFVIKNLADHIRKTYSHHQRQHQIQTQPPPATQEPEAEAETPQPLPTDLPSGVLTAVLDTFQARRIFGKAINKGYMTYCNGHFDWKGVTYGGHNVQLAYLCGKIYGYKYTAQGHKAMNTGNQFPESELYSTFGVDHLQQSLFQFYDRPAKTRQKWIDKLDELFE